MHLEAFKAHEYVAHSSEVTCLDIGPHSGAVVATGGADKRVNVWKVGRASSIWSLAGNSSAIEAVCFGPIEEHLASGSSGGAVKLYDLHVGRLCRNFKGHMSNVMAIHHGSMDRKILATGSMDCHVKLWSTDTKEALNSFRGHKGEVTGVQISPDGLLLASCSVDGFIRLWDLRAGKHLHEFCACPGAVNCIRFNPQECLLAAATSDRMVKLYDVEALQFFCATTADIMPVKSIAFDAEGEKIYAASSNGIKEWTWDNDRAVSQVLNASEVRWDAPQVLHCGSEGQIIAGSFSSNYVSIWAIDFEDEEEGDNTDTQSASSPASSTPRSLQRRRSDGSIAVSSSGAYRDQAQAARSSGVGRPSVGGAAGSPVPPQRVPVTSARERERAARRSLPSNHHEGASPPTFLFQVNGNGLSGAEDKAGKQEAARHRHRVRSPEVVPQVAEHKVQTDWESRNRPFKQKSVSPPARPRSSRGQGGGGPSNGLVAADPKAADLPCRDSGAGVISPEGGPDAKGEDKHSPLVMSREDLEASRPRTAGRKWEPPQLTEDEIIAKSLMNRALATRTLSARLIHLQQLRRCWGAGGAHEAVTHLLKLQRDCPREEEKANVWAVCCDFLGVVDLSGDSMSLETALQIMPLLAGMLELNQERHVQTSLHCCDTLVRVFGHRIKETRAATVMGVDMAAEERLRRCNEMHQHFVLLCRTLQRVQREFYTDEAIQAGAAKLREELDRYFESSTSSRRP